MATYRWRWWFEQSRDVLWPRISDTDWINRRAGLPPVRYEYQALPAGGSRTTATVRLGPLRIQWNEAPFEWSKPDYYAVERQYVSGPIKSFKSRTTLRAENGGTAVEVDVELQARWAAFNWMLPLVALSGRRGADRAFRAAAASVANENKPTQPRIAAARFEGAQWTEGFGGELLEKFAAFLQTAEDRELRRFRAYELADRWDEQRKTVLKLFLTATRGGLLNLRWDVLCAGCRGTTESVESLAELRADAHCKGCNIRFGAQFDRSVEVTFNARPTGRELDVQNYCLAGPHTSRHVVAQETAPATGNSSLRFAVEPGRYVLHAMGVAQMPFSVEERDAPASAAVTLDTSGIVGLPASLAGPRIALRLENALDRGLLVRIEKSQWPDTIVTAADVTAMQEFRDLFSSEVLASGLELGIESMAVLFTDLVGSTAMYSKSGDAPAFRIVNEHFEQMRAVVAQYDGAIVKTIGDAIMAVFRDPGNCLEAALRLPAAVGSVAWSDGTLALRVGLHCGPCIALRANERLDYFGTTVNLASRLEHTAAAGEVVCTGSTGMLSGVQAVIQKHGLHPTFADVAIKGFAQPVRVWRFTGFR